MLRWPALWAPTSLGSLTSFLRPDEQAPYPAGMRPSRPRRTRSRSPTGWAGVLRREGVTMEAAARQLGVSVKTVSRWVGGATEPRLRDLRRIRELFGDIPFP